MKDEFSRDVNGKIIECHGNIAKMGFWQCYWAFFTPMAYFKYVDWHQARLDAKRTGSFLVAIVYGIILFAILPVLSPFICFIDRRSAIRFSKEGMPEVANEDL